MSNSVLLDFYERIRSNIRISDLIRQRINIVKKGTEYQALCPFHKENTPSFTINDHKKFYHCFGCGAHGDVIKFISELDGFSYKDSAYIIAKDNNISLPAITQEYKKQMELSESIIDVLKDASKFFQSKINKKILDYLIARNVNHDEIIKYGIGFSGTKGQLTDYFMKKKLDLKLLIAAGLLGRSEDGKIYEIFRDRIIIPIKNNFGEIIAFGGRVLGNDLPKYKNSPETIIFKKSDVLYGEDIATSAAYSKNRIILVEGYFDVIALQSHGFKESVATLGTAVTPSHIQKMWRIADEIIVCMDGDDAGLKASLRLIENALPIITGNKILSFIRMDKKYDPDNLVNQNGAEFFENILSQRMILSEFIFSNVIMGRSYSSAEERSRIENDLYSYANIVQDKFFAKNLRNFFSQKLWQLFNSRSKKTDKTKHDSLIEKTEKITEFEAIIQKIIVVLVEKFSSFEKEEILNYLINLMEFIESDNIHDNLKISPNLIEMIRYILDFISSEGNEYKEINMLEIVKNSRFFENFNLLSTSFNISFGNALDRFDPREIYYYLKRLLYLQKLIVEYKNILLSDIHDAQREIFYFKEIKDIQDEIRVLSQKYTLTNR